MQYFIFAPGFSSRKVWMIDTPGPGRKSLLDNPEHEVSANKRISALGKRVVFLPYDGICVINYMLCCVMGAWGIFESTFGDYRNFLRYDLGMDLRGLVGADVVE